MGTAPAPVVVTGCQRSGTTWIAAVVTACGHWASHERFFREEKRWPLRPGAIESSWMAAPHSFDARVIHQVRHPLAVIQSCVTRGTFGKNPAGSARYAWKHCPSSSVAADSAVDRAARYWVEWNRLCEPKADLRWQLEQITPARLAEAFTRFGYEIDEGRAWQAMQLVPPINTSPQLKDVGWESISAPLRRKVQRMAARYGYDS